MFGNLKTFIHGELVGWKKIEIYWLVFSTVVILGLSLLWKDSVISTIAAVTGVWYVILTGKGQRSSFIFGLFNIVFYIIVSWQAKYYGEVILNAFYYFPMNFVGWFVWKKHMDDETGEVKKKKLTVKHSVVLYVITLTAVMGCGGMLMLLGGNLPFVDSITTVLSVVAQVLAIWRYAEQWILWIVVNAVSTIMWGVNYVRGGENISTILMWGIYLITAIAMYIRWNKEAK